jgi:hypothetical protein
MSKLWGQRTFSHFKEQMIEMIYYEGLQRTWVDDNILCIDCDSVYMTIHVCQISEYTKYKGWICMFVNYTPVYNLEIKELR